MRQLPLCQAQALARARLAAPRRIQRRRVLRGGRLAGCSLAVAGQARAALLLQSILQLLLGCTPVLKEGVGEWLRESPGNVSPQHGQLQQHPHLPPYLPCCCEASS